MTTLNNGSSSESAALNPLDGVDENGRMAPQHYDAILLASFGGPEGQEDVIPFLRNVTRGRGIPDERLEEVATHYRANGGISPINEQNRALKAALEAELKRRGIDTPVLWGNRNWDPYIKDVLQDAYDAGYRRLLMVTTSVYSSYSSCRQYREDLGMNLLATGLGLLFGAVNVYFRDAENLVDMLLMIATWASPVLYSWIMVRDKLGETYFNIYQLNPITVGVETFHYAFWLPTTDGAEAIPPHLLSMWIPVALAISAAVLLLGQLVFRRLEGRFAQEL